MTGQTDHNLRGDYSRMRPDYTVDQDWDAYTAAQHDLWRRLYARQAVLLPEYACEEFRATLATLDYGAGIPRFDALVTRFRTRATQEPPPTMCSISPKTLRWLGPKTAQRH